MSPQNAGAAELSLLVSKGQARPSSVAQYGGPSSTNLQYRASRRTTDEDDTHGYLPLTNRSFGRKETLETQDKGHEQPASLLSPASHHGLDGLIKRREESTYDPELVAEEPQEATQLIQASQKTESESSPHVRRKMTVRIEMDQFETIDKMAAKTGRTYQDIQAAAIAYYLESDIAEIEHGYDSILNSKM